MTKTKIPQVDLDQIEHFASMNMNDPILIKAFPTKESIRVLGTAWELIQQLEHDDD